MKLFFTRLLIVSLSIFCFNTFADNSNIANTPPGFGLNLTALYLDPGASNLTYAVYTQPLPAPAPHWITNNVNPDFYPAFSLGMQYTLKTGVDQIKLDWMHVDTSDSSSGSASGSASIAPPYYFGPLAQALFNSSATGKADFNVDNVNLAFNHLINVGRYIQLSPLAGFNFSYLKQYLEANFQGDNSDGDHYNITSYNTSKYLGFGPRLGLSGVVNITRHFGILAEMGASLMVGSMNSDTNFRSQGRDNPTAVNTSLSDQCVVRIVSEVNAKVGMTYQFIYHSGSSLEIQAGYLFDAYFDGINQVVPTSLVADQLNNGVVAIETSGQNQSNLDLNGPYLKAVWLFA